MNSSGKPVSCSNGDSFNRNGSSAPGLPVIEEEKFKSLVAARTGEILIITQYIELHAEKGDCFSRPLLGDFLSEATKLEEYLDAYGANNNLIWHPFRQCVASLKLFSNVAYIILHIKHFIPFYHLLPLEQDFTGATDKAFNIACSIIIRLAAMLAEQARALNIPLPTEIPAEDIFDEELTPGRLPLNRYTQKVASAGETAVYLATAFLNLAEESKVLHISQQNKPGDYAGCIPDPISEDRLRGFEQKFHNLQSLYDTYISDSNVESLDKNLPVLRGHITVIYHLLETATALAHYYERHVMNTSPQSVLSASHLINSATLLELLATYSLTFTSRYLLKARSLCHLMLKRYAKKGRIIVPVPGYRGFHVRPSTMIARIVNHYGSEIRMKLEGETYNAALTLDLFRVNEKLNAKKRRCLADEVAQVFPDEQDMFSHNIPGAVRYVIQCLFEKKKLVIYEHNFPLEDLKPLSGETAYQCVLRALRQFLAMGKIDMEIDIKVVFSGDKRVLADIKLLADHGYGEDQFGNNISLPEELSYLRK